jgi:hypothetical protein
MDISNSANFNAYKRIIFETTLFKTPYLVLPPA